MNEQPNFAKHEDDEAPVRIKKYPNRRLYNTLTSQYIVLDDVVELIKSGKEFIIEDTKTGEDLTRSILNQIIHERETGQAGFHFPLDVQKQLILMYDDAYGKMMPDYLRESMSVFVSEREKMKDAFEHMVEYNSKAMAKFGERMAQQNMDYFKQAFDMFQSMSVLPNADKGEDPKSNAEDPSSEPKPGNNKMDQIQQQIDILQEQIKNLK